MICSPLTIIMVAWEAVTTQPLRRISTISSGTSIMVSRALCLSFRANL
jgi:hypothetical protein